jgi:hypothetical protein
VVVWLTVREPPRGHSDPPGLPQPERVGIGPTLRTLARTRSFWWMAAGASLVAMVGYGYAAFQAPMMQRLHGLTPAQFAVGFGLPLSVAGVSGTLLAGLLTEKLVRRGVVWIARLPAIMLAVSAPLYLLAFSQPTGAQGLMLSLWVTAMLLHYGYLGAQYTIGQGVVPQSSRASAIAILLFIIALLGNGLGPQVVGLLSDTMMTLGLEARGQAGVLQAAACNPKTAAALPAAQQAVCAAVYAEGLRDAMRASSAFLLVAAVCFWMSSRSLDRELLAR